MNIDFSLISDKSLLGRTLRLFLKIIPNFTILPIMQGPNQGFRWIKGSGVDGYWLGCYEKEKSILLEKMTQDGYVCYDIGAHTGYYSLIFSRASGQTGTIYAFEPNPSNLSYLSRNIGANRIDNISILPIALGSKDGFSFFIPRSSMSILSETRQELMVPVFRLTDLIKKEGLLEPDIIKIDVEGAELEVLLGMEEILLEIKPILFVAIDDMSKKELVVSFLKKLGYQVDEIDEREIYATNKS